MITTLKEFKLLLENADSNTITDEIKTKVHTKFKRASLISFGHDDVVVALKELVPKAKRQDLFTTATSIIKSLTNKN